MRLFYTGADTLNGVQRNIDKSLGGFISSTQVPNDSEENVFSQLSYMNLVNQRREFRALVLKNLNNVTYTSLNFHFTQEVTPLIGFRFAFVFLDPNTGVMEKIFTTQSTPLEITFFASPLGSGNSLSLLNNGATFKPGDMLGIWVERAVKDSFQYEGTSYSSISQVPTKTLEAFYSSLRTNKNDLMTMIFEFN